MSDPVKCSATCDPVVQVRGKMGPGDYLDVYLPNGKFDENFYKKVDLADANPDDVRVLCKTCGLATGWFAQHFPNAPGAGRDYLVDKIWSDIVATKKTKESMLKTLTEQFGEDAIQKHFGRAL